MKVGFGAFNDTVKGVDVMYGLNNEDSAELFNSIVTTVKLPMDINVDVAFALRSPKLNEDGKNVTRGKGTSNEKIVAKEELNPFGVAIGASKVLKNLQQPTVYAQFVYNVDPYKGYTDGRQNLNMNGYMLDNYGACDGAASFRVGMSWNIQ